MTDGNGNMLSITDERGNGTTYTYDAEDRLTSVTDPEGGRTAYGYDAVGNLTSVTTPEGAYIGCTLEEVTAAYGEATPSESGVLSYTKGDTTLNMILKDNVVASIEYLPAA